MHSRHFEYEFYCNDDDDKLSIDFRSIAHHREYWNEEKTRDKIEIKREDGKQNMRSNELVIDQSIVNKTEWVRNATRKKWHSALASRRLVHIQCFFPARHSTPMASVLILPHRIKFTLKDTINFCRQSPVQQSGDNIKLLKFTWVGKITSDLLIEFDWICAAWALDVAFTTSQNHFNFFCFIFIFL